MHLFPLIIFQLIYPLTARVVGAPEIISQPVSSISPCSPLPSGTWRTPGLSIPWCCLPTSSFVCLVFFPLSLCLAKWFWPDLMNGRHDNTSAGLSGGLRVVRLPAGSWQDFSSLRQTVGIFYRFFFFYVVDHLLLYKSIRSHYGFMECNRGVWTKPRINKNDPRKKQFMAMNWKYCISRNTLTFSKTFLTDIGGIFYFAHMQQLKPGLNIHAVP